MLSNAMQEREQQIKYKKTLSSMTKKQDDAFIKSQKAVVEIAESAESRKLEERQARAYAQRDAQLTQVRVIAGQTMRIFSPVDKCWDVRRRGVQWWC